MARGRGGFIGQDGLNAPDSPTGVTGTSGDTEVSVAFTAPTDVGGSAITGYRVQDGTKAHGASGSSSPVTVTGLTNGTSYTFNVWAINAFGYSAPSDASGSVSPAFARAVFGAGATTSGRSNVLDYVSIGTLSNASDFGDLTLARTQAAACSSSTRGVWAGGNDGSSNVNTIDYITLATTGNATDFGDTLNSTNSLQWSGCSNSTRGLFMGGSGPVNTIQYITIGTTGNALDFGDLTESKRNLAACASPTRGVRGGGSSSTNTIDYVTIATTGNATDFGDLTAARYSLAGCSNSTRGLFGGGAASEVIDFITIATTGNATDFGNLGSAPLDSFEKLSAAASSSRALFGGGQTDNSGDVNIINYVEIASAGNGVDFGDLTVARDDLCACSSAHGGLS